MLSCDADCAFFYLKENEKNICISGAGGTGKSELLVNLYTEFARKKKVVVTTPTGKAAEVLKRKANCDATTLHSWSGCGIAQKDARQYIRFMSVEKKNELKNMQVLMIDEFSMLGVKVLTLVDKIAKILRENKEPMGGMQLVIFGDPFQLEPVKDAPCFRAGLWKSFNFLNIELTHPYRYELKPPLNLTLPINDAHMETEMPISNDINIKIEKIDADSLPIPTVGDKNYSNHVFVTKQVQPEKINTCLTVPMLDKIKTERIDIKQLTSEEQNKNGDINTNPLSLDELMQTEEEINTHKPNGDMSNGLNYYNILLRMRMGVCTEQDLKILSTRVRSTAYIEDLEKKMWERFYNGQKNIVFATHLFTTKKKVSEHNKKSLDLLRTPLVMYTATDSLKHLNNKMRKNALTKLEEVAPRILYIKEYAYVMVTINIPRMGLYNGTTATVLDANQTGSIIIKLDSGEEHHIYRHNFVEEFGGTTICREQFPIILAYGLTAHKAQGSEFTKCVVYTDNLFTGGHAYSMISRCPTLNKLFLVTDFPLKLQDINNCSKSGKAFYKDAMKSNNN